MRQKKSGKSGKYMKNVDAHRTPTTTGIHIGRSSGRNKTLFVGGTSNQQLPNEATLTILYARSLAAIIVTSSKLS